VSGVDVHAEFVVERRGIDSKTARDAMRWRIGNAYYSFLREQYVHALVREAKIGS
jgi:hypothetical protein